MAGRPPFGPLGVRRSVRPVRCGRHDPGPAAARGPRPCRGERPAVVGRHARGLGPLPADHETSWALPRRTSRPSTARSDRCWGWPTPRPTRTSRRTSTSVAVGPYQVLWQSQTSGFEATDPDAPVAAVPDARRRRDAGDRAPRRDVGGHPDARADPHPDTRSDPQAHPEADRQADAQAVARHPRPATGSATVFRPPSPTRSASAGTSGASTGRTRASTTASS